MSAKGNTLKLKSSILIKPRITEKATDLAAAKAPVYTFEVSPQATKAEIAKMIKERYKVTPVMVRIVNLPAKKIRVRGIIGHTTAIKKAMVFLREGDKIELI